MTQSGNTGPEPSETISGLRVLSPYSPSNEEIAQAKSLGSDACPRRYCWWWINTSFEWQLTPAEGCVFLRVKKHPDWKHADTPCCRSDQSSKVDHFEPRMPEVKADGIDTTHWLHREQKDVRKGRRQTGPS